MFHRALGCSPVRYGVALSEHPDASVAVGEVIGQTLDQIGPGPDLAVLFITGHHAESAQQTGLAIRSTLGPKTLLGTTAISVLAHRQEVEETPAIVLWTGHTGPCRGLRLESNVTPLPEVVHDETLVILADPFSYDPSFLLSTIPHGVDVVGGLASAASRPGGNVLMLNDATFNDGAIAAVLPPGLGTRPVVSQGCRPVGQPFTVTAAEDNLLVELGGRPAAERLRELVASADEKTRTMIGSGLHIGLVVDEQREVFEPGDFLIRAILGVDQSQGSVAIGDRIPLGGTVQFQVRDAVTASAELRTLVQSLRADSVLAFTCNGRGSHLFGRPGHDAEHLSDGLKTTAVAGMFCAGEIGPVGGRHFLHGFTASSLLFGAKSLN